MMDGADGIHGRQLPLEIPLRQRRHTAPLRGADAVRAAIAGAFEAMPDVR